MQNANTKSRSKGTRYKREDWTALAECIRTDQLSAKQVYETMSYNPEFAKWYRINYSKR